MSGEACLLGHPTLAHRRTSYKCKGVCGEGVILWTLSTDTKLVVRNSTMTGGAPCETLCDVPTASLFPGLGAEEPGSGDSSSSSSPSSSSSSSSGSDEEGEDAGWKAIPAQEEEDERRAEEANPLSGLF